MHEPFFFSANVDNDAVEHRREHPRTTTQCQKQRPKPDGFWRKDVVEVACPTRVRKHTRDLQRHRMGRPHTRSGARRRRAPGRLCTASARASSPIDQPAVQTEGSAEGLPGGRGQPTRSSRTLVHEENEPGMLSRQRFQARRYASDTWISATLQRDSSTYPSGGGPMTPGSRGA